MPIRPEMRDRYPKDWRRISDEIRAIRAGGRCECRGVCGAKPHGEGRCEAVHLRTHPLTGSKVVLTVAHLDHTPENCEPDNLLAMCQRCHLAYDAEEHKAQASHTRAVRAAEGMDALFAAATPTRPTEETS
jgi:hypothetical protein